MKATKVRAVDDLWHQQVGPTSYSVIHMTVKEVASVDVVRTTFPPFNGKIENRCG